MREPKLFSHRFNFTNPSTMTLTVTHQKDDVVMYIRRQGGRYMRMNESEFSSFCGENQRKNKTMQIGYGRQTSSAFGCQGAVFYSAKIQGNFEAGMEQIMFGQG